jgi:hypothetical protein
MAVMPKLAAYIVMALVFAAFTSTASAYVIRRKIDVPAQTRQPKVPQRTQAIHDWTGPAIPATIWR